MSSTMGSGTQASAAAAATAAINSFLSVAPTKYTAILGTVTGGTAVTGGATATVVWQQQIPIVPAFCTAIDYDVFLPLSVTQVTSAGTSIVSPFFPYSSLSNQITLGGAPPWPLTEMTPWYLDYAAKHIDYDNLYPGLGNYSFLSTTPAAQTSYAIPSNTGKILDAGPVQGTWPAPVYTPNIPTALIPNTTTATVAATSYANTTSFRVRQQLQRKRHLLWGAIPFGDPENRPYNLMQINPLVGVNPEQVSIVQGTGTGILANIAATGTAYVKATYELAYIDLLPPSMTSVPNPQVGYGLQLIQFSTTGLAAGTAQPITHRTAMAYTSIHQLLINTSIPVQADYFGLWDDQDQQSSRWNYDGQNNTMNEYFERYHRTYHHYPIFGHYISDFEGGLFPEIPSVTPYDAVMSPDSSYAAAFGVPVTPAMTTTLRLPTGTTASSPYVRTYAFGLVRVPY